MGLALRLSGSASSATAGSWPGGSLSRMSGAAGAVRIVAETGKPIAQIARDLGVNEGTLGNWVVKDKAAREGTEG